MCLSVCCPVWGGGHYSTAVIKTPSEKVTRFDTIRTLSLGLLFPSPLGNPSKYLGI